MARLFSPNPDYSPFQFRFDVNNSFLGGVTIFKSDTDFADGKSLYLATQISRQVKDLQNTKTICF